MSIPLTRLSNNNIVANLIMAFRLNFELPALPNYTLPSIITTHKIYSSLAFSFFTVIFLYIVLIVVDNARRSKIDLPGPKGWPLIGLGFELPARPRQMLSKYRNRYGDAFKMRLGWYDWVFFNTPEGVKEVFDKQVPSNSYYILRIIKAYVCSPRSHPTK